MCIFNIFKHTKSKMKTIPKHRRARVQSVCNSAVGEHLDSVPCPETEPGAGDTESFQDANPQQLFVFPVFLWTKTGQRHTLKINSWLLFTSTEHLEEHQPQLERGPGLPKGQGWGPESTSRLCSRFLPPGCHRLRSGPALILCSCITLDQAAG